MYESFSSPDLVALHINGQQVSISRDITKNICGYCCYEIFSYNASDEILTSNTKKFRITSWKWIVMWKWIAFHSRWNTFQIFLIYLFYIFNWIHTWNIFISNFRVSKNTSYQKSSQNCNIFPQYWLVNQYLNQIMCQLINDVISQCPNWCVSISVHRIDNNHQ